jgi:adenosylmethionine-8-amino-7-oxononanoate aminotransferase
MFGGGRRVVDFEGWGCGLSTLRHSLWSLYLRTFHHVEKRQGLQKTKAGDMDARKSLRRLKKQVEAGGEVCMAVISSNMHCNHLSEKKSLKSMNV